MTTPSPKKQKMLGALIKENYKQNNIRSVGRRYGGKDAINFSNDIASGGWKNFEYEISTGEPANRNWMHIADFLKAVG